MTKYIQKENKEVGCVNSWVKELWNSGSDEDREWLFQQAMILIIRNHKEVELLDTAFFTASSETKAWFLNALNNAPQNLRLTKQDKNCLRDAMIAEAEQNNHQMASAIAKFIDELFDQIAAKSLNTSF